MRTKIITILHKLPRNSPTGAEFQDSGTDITMLLDDFYTIRLGYGERAWKELTRKRAKVRFNTGRFNRVYVEEMEVICLDADFYAVEADELMEHCK